ncbi:response regulator [Photobacterium indicum]|uniref:Response regulator n=2 Tax=Photobacterium indicum TaxID=81447 RepID=A0A2T3LEJ6_9GAMM|nr:response regulator [Photobacterium indicum]
MSNVSVVINEHICNILMDEQFDNFTVLQLRDTYLSCQETTNNIVEARKVVYRQVLRLWNLGLLDKNETENLKKPTYTKTVLFYKAELQPRIKRTEPEQVKAIPNSIEPEPVIETQSIIHELEKKLKQYQVDLLASIGESEEYMRLYETLPEMKSHLEMQYHQARERSSKLLGQIKAIKTIQSHYKKS